MTNGRYPQGGPRLVWDPQVGGWTNPLDPYYQNLLPSSPAQMQLPPQPPRFYEDSQIPPFTGYAPMPSVQQPKPEVTQTNQGILLQEVASEEEAWKITPNRFTGDWQFFKIGEGDTVKFAVQYYDADIPGTIRRVFTDFQQETVEPKKSPVEEQLLDMQNQLLEIKEMLINVKSFTDDLEKDIGGSGKRSARGKSTGNSGSSDGSGGE